MLAVLYLVMYCDLRSTLAENVFKTLDGERQKMRLQFYFFGFGYVFKGVVYGLEAYLWYSFSSTDSQNYKYIFIIYLITALDVFVADAIPIFFIAFVHHTTFRDMSKSEKMYKQAERHVVYITSNDENATFLGDSKFSILEESIQKQSPKAHENSVSVGSKSVTASENDETMRIYTRSYKDNYRKDKRSIMKSKDTVRRGDQVTQSNSFGKHFMDQSQETDRPHYMNDQAVGSVGTYGQGTNATLGKNR